MAPILPLSTDRDPASLLRQAIVDGVFQPNERLVEEDLALRFHTKRPAIRAALALLEQERLIVHERNRGARVRFVSIEEAAEILECRAALEGLVARKAAERITAAGIATLRDIIAQMKTDAASGDIRGYSECNGRFHATLLDIAHHAASEQLLALLKAQGVRHQYRSALSPGRPAQSLREHTAILDALVAGDPSGAESAMRSHILNVREAVRESAGRLLP
jgi:DNA-binding GntR family transcriptional regulator